MRGSHILLFAFAITFFSPLQHTQKEWFVFFFDCGGSYIKVDLTDFRTVAHGNVADNVDAGILQAVRDGCLIHSVAYDRTSGVLEITVQTAARIKDAEKLPTELVRFQLPEFSYLGKNKPSQQRNRAELQQSLSEKQQTFLNGTRGKPFPHKYVLWSPDKNFALTTSYTPRIPSDTLDAHITPWSMKISLPSQAANHDSFVLYEVASAKPVSQYEIPQLFTDFYSKLLMTDDAGIIFHCENKNGQRTLYAVRTRPTVEIAKIECYTLDAWWTTGIFTDR